MGRVRILMSCPSIHWGEPAAQTIHQQEFLTHLAATGHEVTLIARPPLGGTPLPSASGTVLLVGPTAPPLERVSFSLRSGALVRQLLRDERFDIVHDRGYLGGGAALREAARRGIPAVLQVDDDWPITEGAALPLLRRPALARLAHGWCGRLVGRATRSFAVSEALRASMIHRWGAEPDSIDVVPNGVDPQRFVPNHPDAEAARAALGLGHGPLVVFVGALGPWHGVQTLLQAMAIVRTTIPDAHALIIGGRAGGDEQPALEAWVRSAGLADAVTFTGVVPSAKVPALLGTAAVGVAPYPNIPFGFSPFKIFEYLATGLPVVASDLPWMRESLDGQVARLCTPSSASALAETLVALLQDEPLRRRMGAAARQRAIERHSWAASTAKLLGVYERTLATVR